MSEASGPEAPPAAPASNTIPWAGLAAVLIGVVLSTMNTRISSLGLADIRGAVHAGFDEGAWITTAHTVGQMCVAPIAIWMGRAYGARKILLAAAVAFAFISLLKPLSYNLPMLLGLQFAGGLTSGVFVPLTLGFVLGNMPPKAWAYGIALYSLHLEVSLNISASLEGWYVDNLTWHWIFWQSVPLSFLMALCLSFVGRRDTAISEKPPLDLFGFVAGGTGMGLIYAALDQGNRLDWLNSPLICALLCSGGVVLAAFFAHERTTLQPAVNLSLVLRHPLPLILTLIAVLRLTLLSTSYVVPEFLQVVRGYRALEVGETLIWLAVPQLIVCLVAGYALRRADPRVVATVGFTCICAACLMVAHGLTPLWGSEQFLSSQLLQALGQGFALSAIVFYAVLHLRPEHALTFGAAIQTARLMGGEAGQAFIATFVRVRSQIASNLLGQHVQIGDGKAIHRIHGYATLVGRAAIRGADELRGIAVLNDAIHRMAVSQGIIDAFIVIAACAAATMILVVSMSAAPRGPASHDSPFIHRS